MALMVAPAGAFYVGFTYQDGSDAIFEGSANNREVFETTLSGELEDLVRKAGGRSSDSEIADFKGLAHPLYPNGSVDDGYICGWVKGIGDVTGREFVPFYYMRNGGDFFATIFTPDEDRKDLVKRGCDKALGL